MLLYLGQPAPRQQVQVPDFRGMNRQQANDTAGRLGLFIRPIGCPDIGPRVTACSQGEAPGTELAVGSTVTVQFADGALRD